MKKFVQIKKTVGLDDMPNEARSRLREAVLRTHRVIGLYDSLKDQDGVHIIEAIGGIREMLSEVDLILEDAAEIFLGYEEIKTAEEREKIQPPGQAMLQNDNDASTEEANKILNKLQGIKQVWSEVKQQNKKNDD